MAAEQTRRNERFNNNLENILSSALLFMQGHGLRLCDWPEPRDVTPAHAHGSRRSQHRLLKKRHEWPFLQSTCANAIMAQYTVNNSNSTHLGDIYSIYSIVFTKCSYVKCPMVASLILAFSSLV
ncbi:hypothetical protein AB205_0167150 [Aquarana catesbeiana]|uniref:Uncharacterized protein n=1 Tax=Aquarana catesbeiana TaxID=8400 RepID=A0A2G9SGS0_AQUCT|nr:hypothetical protein AB205_0167150 [Aquarana catesbeiana]